MAANHDICRDCWLELKKRDDATRPEKHFDDNLTKGIHSVYIMYYGEEQDKPGYTKDLNSRLIEVKRKYPNNKLVYFREFMNETEARTYEAWLKRLTPRQRTKLISEFQDKLKKVQEA